MLDLTAYDGSRSAAESPASALDRARDFYQEHAEEILARMRHPSSPTKNLAAEIVLKCEPNARLRAEAEAAVEVARNARDARRALDVAMAAYEPRARSHAARR